MLADLISIVHMYHHHTLFKFQIIDENNSSFQTIEIYILHCLWSGRYVGDENKVKDWDCGLSWSWREDSVAKMQNSTGYRNTSEAERI